MREDADGSRLKGFMARYGDPTGTARRHDRYRRLDRPVLPARSSADAWEPEEDTNGVSRLSRDPGRINDAAALLRYGVRYLATQVNVIPDPNGAPDLVLQANSLAGYMLASAASAFQRRAPMRRCRSCSTWFELPRQNALYCRGLCRTHHHRPNKE